MVFDLEGFVLNSLQMNPEQDYFPSKNSRPMMSKQAAPQKLWIFTNGIDRN
jgi:hypothetical protein